MDYESDFKRKVKIRKFAIENMGVDNRNLIDFQSNPFKNSDLISLVQQLNENLQDATQNMNQDGYWLLNGNKFSVFIKKVLRKLIKIFFGWYVFPIFSRQSFFNGKTVNVLSLSRDIIIKQQQLIEEQNKKINYILSRLNITCDIDLLKMVPEMDYFDFENHFRGPRETVKQIQKHYIEYFKENGGGEILDIGCGRGEFLELMFDYGIPARGVDSYQPFIDYCENRGFHVERADALTYLNSLEDSSLGGIFMGQVVEHLSEDYLRSIIALAYKKLKQGCYFIVETPNPDCVAALTEFYIDLGHIKPVHYKTLEYLFKKANFESVFRFHTPECKYPLQMVNLDGGEIKNLDEFNQGIQYVNSMLFGFRDYTLIARK